MSLGSGSSGNCYYLATETYSILIDAGMIHIFLLLQKITYPAVFIRYSFFQRRLYLFLFQNTSRQPDRNFQNFVVILMNPCTRKKDPASRQDPYHQENLAISSS